MVLKIVIALLALILLGFLVLIFHMGARVEYTDGGVRVVLPWLEEPSDEPEQSPAYDLPPVVVIDDPEMVEPYPEPTAEPSRPEPVRAVEVSTGDLIGGNAAALVTDAGGNTLVVEMKAPSGKVYWESAAALTGAVSDPDGAVTAAIAALAQQGELHLVARVSCFRDQIMASAGVGGPLMTRGGNVWYDAGGLRWVSPASEQARDYLSQLCLELAELGFDEILLDYAGYPYFGEVHVLAVDELRPEDLSGAVEQFWRELKQELAQRNVRLSVLAQPEMVEGDQSSSGITPTLLERYADRVWADALPEDSPLTDRLVTVGGTETDESWASLKD